MCRLYLYTTLKIEEILEVVHRHHNSHEAMPGYVSLLHHHGSARAELKLTGLV